LSIGKLKKAQVNKINITGHVYRYGPNSLSFNTNTALQSVYGLKANCKKGNFYTVFPQKKDVYNVHSEIDPKRHAYKWRVVSYAFSDKALKAMEEYIINNIQKFCAHLSSSSPQDMAILCNYLTFDVLGDLGFGKSFGMLDRPENRFVPELIMNAGRQAVIVRALCSQVLSTLMLADWFDAADQDTKSTCGIFPASADWQEALQRVL
jgi:hypothetical protein